jgi:DNA-binding CsgD family transcriptional regulator
MQRANRTSPRSIVGMVDLANLLSTTQSAEEQKSERTMKHLTETDLRSWLDAITQPPRSLEELSPWLEGPLRKFFPYRGLVLGCGELVAGQLKVTHMLATGHEEAYLRQLATTFELEHRGSLKWWFSTRQPFYIDPKAPPSHTSAFELEEIEKFNLRNVAGHGVLNIKANAGTYFGFTGVREPLSEWHLETLRLMAPVLNDLLLTNLAASQQESHAALTQLTKRQTDIVRYVATGLNDKAIARALGITEKTVRNHLVNTYKKLDMHKRTELIALLK